MLWSVLRNRQILGAGFRKQVVKGRFIFDFYCSELKLAIEVDGKEHLTRVGIERDYKKDSYSDDCKIRVLRIGSKQIVRDIPGVVDIIKAEILLRRA